MLANRKLWVLIGLIIVGGAFAAFFIPRGTPEIPNQIRHKASFSILDPDPSQNEWRIDKQSVSYSGQTGVLTFNVHNADRSNQMSVSEQSTPDPFNDVPNYMSILLSKLNAYQSLQTSIGTVALTKPTELKGGQTAVANIKQTLMFIRPAQNLTDNQWQAFFNDMQWD